MIDLDGIRKRDAIAVTFDSVGEHTNVCAAMGDIDRRALLAYVDKLLALLHRTEDEKMALRAAAGKVTCMACCGSGDMGEGIPCPDCADLRALLNPPA